MFSRGGRLTDVKILLHTHTHTRTILYGNRSLLVLEDTTDNKLNLPRLELLFS